LTTRLWPMMAGVCAGTWAGVGLMSGAGARYGTMLLGIALARQSKNAEAAKAFDGVKDPKYAEVARLWKLHLR